MKVTRLLLVLVVVTAAILASFLLGRWEVQSFRKQEFTESERGMYSQVLAAPHGTCIKFVDRLFGDEDFAILRIGYSGKIVYLSIPYTNTTMDLKLPPDSQGILVKEIHTPGSAGYAECLSALATQRPGTAMTK